jgi:hypothetical protein
MFKSACQFATASNPVVITAGDFNDCGKISKASEKNLGSLSREVDAAIVTSVRVAKLGIINACETLEK